MSTEQQNRSSDKKWAENPDILRDFQAPFFAMSRLGSFPWTFVEKDLERNKSSEIISEILNQTCFHPLCRKFPPSFRYRRLFISELIRRLEASDCEPLDELYDALAQVLGAKEEKECYKNYILPCGEAVSLSESVAVISEGTTGLVTWEAALHLTEWALDHQHIFTDRTVLELGSGVGLTGVAICRSCRPSTYVFSDCHPSVLHRLRANVGVNGLDERTARVEELDWSTVTEQQLAAFRADTVIAADVVYDPDVVVVLVKVLSMVLKVSSAEVLICSTVRNTDTYSSFKQQLEKAGIFHNVITDPVRHVFPYNRVSDIEMIKLFRK